MAHVADLVKPPPLVVTVAELARRLEVTLDDTTRPVLEDAIRDTQDDVEAYLGRVITPAQFVEEHLYPWPGGWDLEHHPVVDVLSAVEETDDDGNPTGLFTVTYLAGLDARADRELRPILRYVRAHAMSLPPVVRLWRATNPDDARTVTSLSVEGQSVSYANTTPTGGGQPGPGSGAPGAAPTLTSLDRWRVAGRRVFQRRTPPRGPWPYTGDREWRAWH